MEYCEPFWAPHLRKDVLVLERVQRRFTRMIPGMKSLSYEERLGALGLYSLEFRRMRAHLIETYRILCKAWIEWAWRGCFDAEE